MKVQYYPRFEIHREASSSVAPPLRQASPPSLLPFAGLLRRPHLRRPSPEVACAAPIESQIPSLVALPRRDRKLPRRGPELPRRRPPFPIGWLLRRSSGSFPAGRISLAGRLPPLQPRARGQPPLLLAAPFCSCIRTMILIRIAWISAG